MTGINVYSIDSASFGIAEVETFLIGSLSGTASWAEQTIQTISSSYSKTSSVMENIEYGHVLLLMG